MLEKIKFVKNVVSGYLKKEPYKLNFAITNICNSRCITCNTWEKYKKEPLLLKEELNGKEIETIFRNLPKSITWLSLTGGEPFLKKEIIDIVSYAISYLPNLSLINIPTNGLADGIPGKIKEILELPNRPYLYVTFSIDGPPFIHNKIRGLNDAFEKTWRSYERALKLKYEFKNFEVGFETTVSHTNVNKIYHFLAKHTKTHNVMINIAHNTYLYKNIDNDNLISSDYTQILSQILNVIIKNGKWYDVQNLLKRMYFRKIPQYIAHPQCMIYKCVALESSFAINPYGDVLPCLMWGEVIGNVRNNNYSITSILESRRKHLVRNAIIDKQCPICWTPCEATQAIFNKLLSVLFHKR